MHWPRVFRAAIQHDDLPFLASPLECCDCVADFARRGPYSLCASRRMVFDAPQRDLTLSLHKIHKGLSPTCSQRIEVSRAVLVHETGQWIFEGTTFGTKLHVSAAPSRARWLSVAMQCTLAARHTHYAAARHRQFCTSYDRMSLEHHYSR